MIAAAGFNGKRVALFGLGGSGLATANALLAGGAEVVAWDDNPSSVASAAHAGITVADLREIDWSDTASLVLAPGVPLTHPKPHWSVELARRAGAEIIGDIEIFARERARRGNKPPFIGITGTNGKSTTSALIAHMLNHAGRDAQLGGNIGKAVLTLDPMIPDRYYVVECSSYQIDLAPTINPTAGILLNISPDHLDRHGTIEHYASVKERLVAGSELAIVGVDDQYCLSIAARLADLGQTVVRISAGRVLRDGYFAGGTELKFARDGEVETVGSLAGIGSLRGRHNAQNALAAVAACQHVGLDYAQIQAGLQSFPGLVHRMEQVGRKAGVLFVNDSKATNAEAAATALASFDHIYWIAGGLAKEGGIEALRQYFPRIAKAYLIGEAAPAFSATLGDSVDYEISETLGNAVAHAASEADRDPVEDSVVLFSPACASFDQYKNFEIRGEAFRDAVLALDGVKAVGAST